MFCMNCGTQMPDDAKFCPKCGATVKPFGAGNTTSQQQAQGAMGTPSGGAIGSAGAGQLKCPGCGAPIVPKLDEAVITCEFCGTSIQLGNEGWTNVRSHTMLAIKFPESAAIISQVGKEMDSSIFHRHLQEQSKLEETTLTVVPYWVLPVSARTRVTFVMSTQNRQVITKTEEVDENYEFPVVAVKAMNEYQPKEFQFALKERVIFDGGKIPKSLKVLNGDVSQEAAKGMAKTLVSQLQYKKAHDVHKFHSIEQLDTQLDVSEGELLHAPVWYVRYDHDGKKITFVVDANSGGLMSSLGI
jgi:hypothetical protein